VWTALVIVYSAHANYDDTSLSVEDPYGGGKPPAHKSSPPHKPSPAHRPSKPTHAPTHKPSHKPTHSPHKPSHSHNSRNSHKPRHPGAVRDSETPENVCTPFQTGADCVGQGQSYGCTWCGSTQRCLLANASADCPNADNCFKPWGKPCSPTLCALYTNPVDCGYGQGTPTSCAWCASSQTCHELGIDTVNLCEGKCVTECQKIWGQPLSQDVCSSYPSSSPGGCAGAQYDACGWCASSQKCMELNLQFNETCPGGGCDDNCLEHSGDPIPEAPCSSYTDPGSCGGQYHACGWCCSSNTCVELNNKFTDACGADQGQCATSCLKQYGNSLPPSPLFCSNYTGPGDCLWADDNANACAWCASTQQCYDVQIDLKDTCGASHGQCPENCLKNWGDAGSGNCATYTTCGDCIWTNDEPNSCGWCELSNSCVELGKDLTPCEGSCGDTVHWDHLSCPST